MSVIVNGWIPARFTDPMPLDPLRRSIYTRIGEPEQYTLETDPHISLFGFEIPRENLDAFKQDFDTVRNQLLDTTFDMAGFYVYPSLDNPMVVAIKPNLSIENECETAIDILHTHRGSVRWGPTPPHITLFKGGDGSEEDTWPGVSESTNQQLRTSLDEISIEFSFTIGSVPVEH